MNIRTIRHAEPSRVKVLAIGMLGALVASGVAAGNPVSATTLATSAATVAQGRPTVGPASALAATCSLTGATRSCHLWARAGSVVLPVVGATTFWSYTGDSIDPVTPTGPTLVVNQGETVDLVLHNTLGTGQATSLSVPQVDGFTEDTVGVGSGGVKTYTFTATRPGTFLYEAGGTTNGARQVAMGMVGALVVLPTTPGSAYGSAATAYTDEAVVLLTDVDPALHAAPTTFDMRSFNPKVHLLDGATFPQTAPIPVTPGSTALLRVVNGGVIQHAMGVLGTTQRVVAEAGRPLAHPYGVAAENVPAGDSLDLIVDIPAATGLKYALYDASTRLDTSSANATGVVPFGGALTFLDTGTGVPPATGPTVTGLSLTPARTGGATPSPLAFTATAGPGTTALEYVIDDASRTPGTGTPVAGGPGIITGTIPVASLADGNHTLLLRATDGVTWGAFAAATFVVDKAGPATTGVTLTPSATGTAGSDVTVGAAASDLSTGGSNVTVATFTIDGGTPNALTLSPTSAVAVELTGSIPAAVVAALTEGPHTVSVTSTDEFGNSGAATSGTLLVDRTAPTVSGVTVRPSPNSGSQGIPSDPTSVEVRASYADPGTSPSGVVGGEAFLGTLGPVDTGFPMSLYPAGSPTQLLGTFPVTELTRFTDGSIPVYVRAKDRSGNWGTASVGAIVISRDTVFASTFESPSSLVPPWSGLVTGGVLAGARSSVGGSNQFVVTRTGAAGSFSNATARAYLIDTTPSAETRYNGRFTFTPNTQTTGTTVGNARVWTVFQARNAAGGSVLAVQYRSYGSTRQVRMTVGFAATPWTTLATGNGPVPLRFTWVSGASATATFSIGSQPVQSLSGLNTSANTVETVWLGVSASTGTGTVSATPNNTISFDNFDSRRITAP